MAPASNESLCVMVLRSIMNVPRKTDSGSAGTLAWEGISRSIARQWCGQSRRSISRRDCFSTSIGRRAMPQKIHHETAHCFLVTRWPKKTPQKRLFSLVAREFKPTDSSESVVFLEGSSAILVANGVFPRNSVFSRDERSQHTLSDASGAW